MFKLDRTTIEGFGQHGDQNFGRHSSTLIKYVEGLGIST